MGSDGRLSEHNDEPSAFIKMELVDQPNIYKLLTEERLPEG
jgi:hypothetical protein